MDDGVLTEQEIAEINAIAWLSLTDYELIERSASLGLPPELHPEPGFPDATFPTKEQLVEARRVADENAVEHAGQEFVNNWIAENRVEELKL